MLDKLKADGIAGPFASMMTHGALRARHRATGIVTAAEAVGDLSEGAIVTGITKGSFSMIDLIEHLMTLTGPAAIDVSTWTMGVYDADLLWKFASNGAITKIRFMLDPSIFKINAHKVAHSQAFLAAFGGEAIRAVSNHAKFTVIRGSERAITVCGSMNLNRNTRLENFTIFDGDQIAAFYSGIMDQVFEQVAPIADAKRVSWSAFASLYLGDDDGGSDRGDWNDGANPGAQRGPPRAASQVW